MESQSNEPSHRKLQRTKSAALNYANKKLIFVPLVFIIARIWGTLRFILDICAGDGEPSGGLQIAIAVLAPIQVSLGIAPMQQCSCQLPASYLSYYYQMFLL